MKFSFDHNSETITTDFTPAGKGYRATIGKEAVDVELLQSKDGRLDLLIDGKRLTAYISVDNARRWVTVNGQTFVLTKSSSGRSRGHAGQHPKGQLIAPMPGQVRAVNVSEGEAVTKGQTLLVLEAMKMEIRIHAPRDSKVIQLLVKQGQIVDREQMLIEIE